MDDDAMSISDSLIELLGAPYLEDELLYAPVRCRYLNRARRNLEYHSVILGPPRPRNFRRIRPIYSQEHLHEHDYDVPYDYYLLLREMVAVDPPLFDDILNKPDIYDLYIPDFVESDYFSSLPSINEEVFYSDEMVERDVLADSIGDSENRFIFPRMSFSITLNLRENQGHFGNSFRPLRKSSISRYSRSKSMPCDLKKYYESPNFTTPTDELEKAPRLSRYDRYLREKFKEIVPPKIFPWNQPFSNYSIFEMLSDYEEKSDKENSMENDFIVEGKMRRSLSDTFLSNVIQDDEIKGQNTAEPLKRRVNIDLNFQHIEPQVPYNEYNYQSKSCNGEISNQSQYEPIVDVEAENLNEMSVEENLPETSIGNILKNSTHLSCIIIPPFFDETTEKKEDSNATSDATKTENTDPPQSPSDEKNNIVYKTATQRKLRYTLIFKDGDKKVIKILKHFTKEEDPRK